VACDSTKLILKTFGKLIKANIAPQSTVGVDISREERYDYILVLFLFYILK
jgi:hypothetical protein